MITTRVEVLAIRTAVAAADRVSRRATARTSTPVVSRRATASGQSAPARNPVQNLFNLKEDEDELGDGSGDEDDPLIAALTTYTRQAGAASSYAGPAETAADEAADPGPDLSALIQLQMLKEMKRMQKKDDGG
eukprot:12642935-Heterocapsa_arctica.AAC.1